MNSDNSGDNPSLANYNNGGQKSFDAYQLNNRSSFSAKNNLRQPRKAPSHLLSRDVRDNSQNS